MNPFPHIVWSGLDRGTSFLGRTIWHISNTTWFIKEVGGGGGRGGEGEEERGEGGARGRERRREGMGWRERGDGGEEGGGGGRRRREEEEGGRKRGKTKRDRELKEFPKMQFWPNQHKPWATANSCWDIEKGCISPSQLPYPISPTPQDTSVGKPLPTRVALQWGNDGELSIMKIVSTCILYILEWVNHNTYVHELSVSVSLFPHTSDIPEGRNRFVVDTSDLSDDDMRQIMEWGYKVDPLYEPCNYRAMLSLQVTWRITQYAILPQDIPRVPFPHGATRHSPPNELHTCTCIHHVLGMRITKQLRQNNLLSPHSCTQAHTRFIFIQSLNDIHPPR